jgi:hypothetical protein
LEKVPPSAGSPLKKRTADEVPKSTDKNTDNDNPFKLPRGGSGRHWRPAPAESSKENSNGDHSEPSVSASSSDDEEGLSGFKVTKAGDVGKGAAKLKRRANIQVNHHHDDTSFELLISFTSQFDINRQDEAEPREKTMAQESSAASQVDHNVDFLHFTIRLQSTGQG